MREFRIGDIVVGRVTGVKNYGLFVALEEGKSGLVHITEISDKYIADMSTITSLGEYILVQVIGFNNEKLKLSIKNIEYRTKKTSISLQSPKITVDSKEFDVLKQFVE